MTPEPLPERPAADAAPAPVLRLASAHRQRLRAVWRSAGWPCQDGIEAELIAAGLLERRLDPQGRVHLALSDAGVQELVRARAQNRQLRGAHEALVARVAATLARDGRLAWCGLSLRAPLPAAADEAGAAPHLARDADPAPDLVSAALAGFEAVPPAAATPRWVMAMPDVYSIRPSSVAAGLLPQVHEIKVRRADLLADLRQPHKRGAYLGMAGALFYVLAEGIGDADDVPPDCGVLLARGALDEHAECAEQPVLLELQRNAPRRALDAPAGLPLAVWLALARHAPQAAPEDAQLAW